LRRGFQIGRNLGLAAGLLSMSLALGGLVFPLGHVRAADMTLDKVRHLDSIVGVVLSKGRHVTNDLATLYKIRKLAAAAPRPATPPATDAVDSSQPSPPVEICSGVFRGPTKRLAH
jgi:hypothetical protein